MSDSLDTVTLLPGSPIKRLSPKEQGKLRGIAKSILFGDVLFLLLFTTLFYNLTPIGSDENENLALSIAHTFSIGFTVTMKACLLVSMIHLIQLINNGSFEATKSARNVSRLHYCRFIFSLLIAAIYATKTVEVNSKSIVFALGIILIFADIAFSAFSLIPLMDVVHDIDRFLMTDEDLERERALFEPVADA
uniref:DUF2214 domain-containing protein n=1 Tax=Caenorhabditis tropicalis TaxID=1561998 RepID=A0A1I7U7R5_9PELO